MTERTCSGACCSALALQWLPHDQIEAERAREDNDPDRAYVLDMVTPLTRTEARERARRFGGSGPRDDDTGPETWYTCRHWDEVTRLCQAHDERPEMCRDYPYERDCTLSKACGYRAPEEIQKKWRLIKATRGEYGWQCWDAARQQGLWWLDNLGNPFAAAPADDAWRWGKLAARDAET